MKAVLFSIPAIHCHHCTHTISMELSEIEGVSRVIADLDLKMIKVTYSPPAKESILREKLAEINYPAED